MPLLTAVGPLALLVLAAASPGGHRRGTDLGGSAAGPAGHGSRAPSPDTVERTDLTRERVIAWHHQEVVSDRAVRILAWTGHHSAYGVRSVAEEDASRVRIAVVEGTPPDAPETVPALAVQARLLVTLETPLGDREVVPLPAEQVDLAD